jgi:NAD(P)-dependent dehydrogenase (short-subunit alcohol dehydrogenase family)
MEMRQPNEQEAGAMSLPAFSLEGNVAIVTGAGRGIGRAIAVAFAQSGASVVAAARTLPQIEETVEIIRGQGAQALAVPTDVLKIDEIAYTLQKTLDTFGRVDILVNNAGGLPDDIPPAFNSGYILNVSIEEWKSEIELNLNSLFYCSKIVGTEMARQRSGTIINISSGMGLGPFPGMAAAAAARAGVFNFTKSLAYEWAPYNIRVNCLAPGFTETPLTARDWEADPGLREALLNNVAQGRFAKPEDMAAVCTFLASPASSYITGETIFASGGMMSLLPPGYGDYLRRTRGEE